ncbi:hypothetical protein Chor_014544 [Crotalus horridus]
MVMGLFLKYRSHFDSSGISTSNGHNWRQQRRFALTALRTLGVGKKDTESKIKQVTHRLVETFARTKGQPIDPLPFVTSSVCNVICLLTLGYCFSPEDTKFQMILEDISNFTKFGGSAFLLVELQEEQIEVHLLMLYEAHWRI